MSDHTKTNLITLTRHVFQDQVENHKEASGDLTLLLTAIQLGCKFVASNVRKASLISMTGLANTSNIQGEEQKKLDVIANEIFVNALRSSNKVAIMVSEEDEEAIIVEDKNRGKYCVVFDPLDGSSNIDCGVSIGTIFGIYKVKEGSTGQISDVLRPGSEMVAAGYCTYGSCSTLVLTTGQGVNGYTLDTEIGEFILTHPDIQIPTRGKIYAVNEGNSKYWDEPCKKYFHSLKFPEDPKKSPYSARYVGSMVADVHRTMLYGGIFCYPADSKSKNGKLRILYECFPMAFLVEQAGGRASTGLKRMLDVQPQTIHSRSPIFLGSKSDVEDIEALYQAEQKA
ncbi:Fructose-1,6-bisphosphatase [Entomortierella chlamydospora]|uniref:Fructose-1,6-bisphosphatase n=1 Tax=Entomortierella chlamydospora TaxID=101097 RepID=A0A9P6T1H5_9FUNG|nr:Fructose-1,6-bisphosphatase [Entomortierella chlamydospora]KAG0018308.1 Fructose-1,6-bisphosphatase [Entomortierella chlamydospora]